MAWFGLLVFALLLAYGGGLAMFLYHAVYLGEGGPAISPWQHWLLDSTAAFVGLTPAIALIVPIAGWLAATGARTKTRIALFALTAGVMFAVVTAPGPLLHNAFVGRGTWIADKATEMWGVHHQAVPITAVKVGVPVEIARQVALGLPLYILLMGLALLVTRAIAPTAPEGRRER